MRACLPFAPELPFPVLPASINSTDPAAPFPFPSNTETSRDAALTSVSGLTEQVVDAVNAGTVEVFENQKRVEEQARELRRKGAKFAGVTSEWVRIVRGFDDDLREIGDFEGMDQARGVRPEQPDGGHEESRGARDGRRARGLGGAIFRLQISKIWTLHGRLRGNSYGHQV